jgi:hypothetical protein
MECRGGVTITRHGAALIARARLSYRATSAPAPAPPHPLGTHDKVHDTGGPGVTLF